LIGDGHERAYVLDGLGYFSSQLNKPGAVGLFRQAAQEGARFGDDFLRMASTSALSKALRKSGMTRSALRYCKSELHLSRRLGIPVFTELALRDSGETYLTMGRTDVAIRYLQRALSPHLARANVAEEADTTLELAEALERAGKLIAAQASYEQASFLGHSAQYTTTEAEALYRLASLQAKLGRKQEAQLNVESSIELAEAFRLRGGSEDAKAFWFGTVHQFYELEVFLLMSQPEPLPDSNIRMSFEASEKSRSRTLVELLCKSNTYLSLGVDPALARKKEALDQTIADLSLEAIDLLSREGERSGVTKLVDKIAAASRVDSSVNGEILAQYPKFAELASNLNTVSSSQAQSLLSPDDVLIEYKLGDDQSFAWVLTANNLGYFRLPRKAVIEPLVREFIAHTSATMCQAGSACADNDDPRFKRLCKELTVLLLGPAEKELTRRRIILVNDGILQYMPFSALDYPTRSQTSETLTDSHEIVYLPSASALAAIRAKAATARPRSGDIVAVFADPVFESDDPRIFALRQRPQGLTSSLAPTIKVARRDIVGFRKGIPRLPGTRREAASIAVVSKTAHIQLNMDFDASVQRLVGTDVASSTIVHFATHSILDARHPESSGIVLSLFEKNGNPTNGYLGLKDIYGLHLSARLVVLSACSTALGANISGEGVIGLTQGFLYAGAPSVVATLWKVDDEATSVFMGLFYGALLNEDQTPAAALRAAQLAMSRQPRWRSPYYWSGFVLIGDWR
jgi:CHAT domain-containing protein/tetratricopeptide (TPR) repeat protein